MHACLLIKVPLGASSEQRRSPCEGEEGTRTLEGFSRKRQVQDNTKCVSWTPKVCRIMAFNRFWPIFLPTFGGLGCGFLQVCRKMPEENGT